MTYDVAIPMQKYCINYDFHNLLKIIRTSDSFLVMNNHFYVGENFIART